jgi:hypothetical protein
MFLLNEQCCCWTFSPHQARRIHSADFPIEFGKYAVAGSAHGSVKIPNDIQGLPSTQIGANFPIAGPFYEAEIDQGYAFQACCLWTFLLPCVWPCTLGILMFDPSLVCKKFECNPICCWINKEFSTRRVFQIFNNRISMTNPTTRMPWAYLGCGSWSIDNVEVHMYDRGFFGFHRVR